MEDQDRHKSITGQSVARTDIRCALTTYLEELEAVDRYNQHIRICSDHELGAILARTRDKKKDYAEMLLDWIRRKDVMFYRDLRDHLSLEAPGVRKQKSSVRAIGERAG